MADTEFVSLIRRLADRTSEGKVNWQSTSRDGEFIIFFQKFSLSVRAGMDEENDSYVTFSLRNEAGKKIDDFWVWDTNEFYSTANGLWGEARRRALRIDEALESLISELDSGNIIGDPPESPPETDSDEEFPF